MSGRIKTGHQIRGYLRGFRPRPRLTLALARRAAVFGQEPNAPMFDWRRFDPSMVSSDSGYSFVDEFTTYRDRLDELLQREGEFVVIKGREIIGIFPNRDQALLAAIDRFGEEPTLVKQIVAEEPFVTLGNALP